MNDTLENGDFPYNLSIHCGKRVETTWRAHNFVLHFQRNLHPKHKLQKKGLNFERTLEMERVLSSKVNEFFNGAMKNVYA